MPSINWNKRWSDDLKKNAGHGNIDYYGAQWGDPAARGIWKWLQKIRMGRKLPGDLSKIPPKYILPYVSKESVLLEIGPGGGRWTQYFLDAKEIILVDLNPDFFPYLQDRFKKFSSKLRFYQTSGYELDGIASDYVDFIFTFGTFVHIDPEGIDCYLDHIKRVLKIDGVAAIQYADKTKEIAQQSEGFSDMNAGKMEDLISKYNFRLLEHNLSLLNHSNIAVIRK
jgi:SAM-dependent methyltransferase